MTTTITGTVTAITDARTTTDLPGNAPWDAYTLHTDDGTEHTVLAGAGPAADVAFGKDRTRHAEIGQRVTCTAAEGPFGLVAQPQATGERDENGRKIRATFTVED